MLTKHALKPLILTALQEDIATGDVTSEAIFSPTDNASAVFLVKQNGVLCGLELARWVCEEVATRCNDTTLQWEASALDGDLIRAGTVVATVHARAITLLQAERTALNFLQRLSGVASLTRIYVQTLAGTATKVADTRKTIPGWRMLDKYAVATGGGMNHRIGLFDMALIKDNHRDAAGSLTAAITKCLSLIHI